MGVKGGGPSGWKTARLLALDTSILIPWLEAKKEWKDSLAPIFSALESGRPRGVISAVALMEVLVGPYSKGREDVALRLYGLIATHPCLRVVDLDAEIADLAARIRAKHGLKTPDAVHLATAQHTGAVFVTADRKLARVREVPTILLSPTE